MRPLTTTLDVQKAPARYDEDKLLDSYNPLLLEYIKLVKAKKKALKSMDGKVHKISNLKKDLGEN